MPPATNHPSVSAVVLNHRHPDEAVRAVDSLQRSTHPISVIVVDNGSSDGDLATLRRGVGRDVAVIETGDNLGYAGGNNVGIRAALDDGADLVWVVNPDVVVGPDTLDVLVRTSTHHPQAGIFGSRIYVGGSDPKRIWFDGGLILWDRGGATRHLGWGKTDGEMPAPGPFTVDYVTGAAMLVRSAVFADVGLLPEEYFLYFEETDFGVRAQRAGWSAMVDSRSRLDHFTRSLDEVPEPHFVYYFIRNRILFGTRFTGWRPAAVVADLQSTLDSLGRRVAAGAPGWVATFEHLVALAIEDGTAGRTGRRDDIAELPAPGDRG